MKLVKQHGPQHFCYFSPGCLHSRLNFVIFSMVFCVFPIVARSFLGPSLAPRVYPSPPHLAPPAPDIPSRHIWPDISGRIYQARYIRPDRSCQIYPAGYMRLGTSSKICLAEYIQLDISSQIYLAGFPAGYSAGYPGVHRCLF